MLLEDFKKHLGEAEDGIGGETFGIRKMADGIKGTKDVGGAIDQKESRTFRHNHF